VISLSESRIFSRFACAWFADDGSLLFVMMVSLNVDVYYL
jgi:hypothetical protein